MSWFRLHRPNQIKNLHLVDVRQTFLKLMKKGEIPQVMLFAGPKGTGKTSSARIIGAILNDEKNQPMVDYQFFSQKKPKIASYQEPNQDSKMIMRILQGRSYVVQEMDAASNRGIDDIREIKERVSLSPQEGKMTVYILDEAHMLTAPAFNALLKLLEEPPAHVVFILATTELHKIPSTVKSRCSLINFRKASLEEIKAALTSVLDKEKVKYELEAVEAIAYRSEGSFRDAVKLLQMVVVDHQLTVAQVEKTLFASAQKDVATLIENLLAKNEQAVAKLFIDLRSRNVDQHYFYKAVIEALHTSMLVSLDVITGECLVEKKIAQFLLNQLAIIDLSVSPIPHLALELKILELIDRAKDKADNTEQNKHHSQRSEKTTQKSTIRSLETPALADLKLPTSVSAKWQKSGDSQKLFANWQELLKEVKKRNFTLEALLRSAKPLKSDNGTAHVEVFYQFHKEQLEQPKFKALISDCAQAIAGGQVQFIYQLTKTPQIAELTQVNADKDLATLAEELLI